MNRRICVHALCLLVVYQSVRLLFWWVNRIQFHESSPGSLLNAFVEGVRFDLAAIALTNALLYLFFLLPLPRRWRHSQRLLSIAFCTALNSFFIALNIVDVEYYKFTGKRLTLDSLAIGQDIGQHLGQVTLYYWYYSILIGAASYVLLLICRRWLDYDGDSQPSLRVGIYRWLGAAVVLVVLGRGGWQHKPLIPAHAYAAEGPRLGVLVLNSSFTFVKSSGKATLPVLNFYADARLREILAPDLTPAPKLTRRPRHVILVIMESFATEYVFPRNGRPSFTPFVKSLAARGSYFPHAFANGRRSIDAIPSILASIPAWMDPPYITSPYQTNRIIGLAQVLKDHGWSTAFYHGGNNGTMFFDVMAQQLGFERYIGAQEYPNSADSDGQWGIFDEPFLQFAARDLVHTEKPFFATLFILSSHHPYRIPDQYRGRFAKGSLEIHESLGYADFALQQFYEFAQRQAWFEETLFIFTADHTSKSEDPTYETSYGRFAVPIIFLQNNRPLPFAKTDVPVQHADIMPTVLDILGIETAERAPFGHSLLRPLQRPGVVLFEGGTYHLVSQDELLSYTLHGTPRRYAWQEDPLLHHPLAAAADSETELNFLKAQVQSYNNGMVRNQLIW